VLIDKQWSAAAPSHSCPHSRARGDIIMGWMFRNTASCWLSSCQGSMLRSALGPGLPTSTSPDSEISDDAVILVRLSILMAWPEFGITHKAAD